MDISSISKEGAKKLINQLVQKLKEFNIFSWKPDISVHGAPIPLYFDYETFEMPLS